MLHENKMLVRVALHMFRVIDAALREMDFLHTWGETAGGRALFDT